MYSLEAPWQVFFILKSAFSRAMKVVGIRSIFFLFLNENICCGYSLEAPQGKRSYLKLCLDESSELCFEKRCQQGMYKL